MVTPEEKNELCGRAKRLVEQKGDTVKAPRYHRRLRYEDSAVVIEWTTYQGPFPVPYEAQFMNHWSLQAKVSVSLGSNQVGFDQPTVASQTGTCHPWIRTGDRHKPDWIEKLPEHVLTHLREVMDE